jgi:putative FmdB family regulatory protein
MPLYEYQCNTCGEEFEKMVRFSEAELTPACPACQGEDTRKKISAFASLAAFLTGDSSSNSSSCTPRGGFS